MEEHDSTDSMLARFLGVAQCSAADPATPQRVLARMDALLWQQTIAEWPDGRWHVEIFNKEGLTVGEGPTRQAAIYDAALRASGLRA